MAAKDAQVDMACMDYLHMELVDYIVRSSTEPDLVFSRLEPIGFCVGQRLSERYAKDRPRFQSSLDIIKFICKEFWIGLFKKAIDNLRTNHRGVFVLTDNKFRWVANISPLPNNAVPGQAMNYVVFACGLLRGALTNLGVACDVSAELGSLPTCMFTIKIKK